MSAARLQRIFPEAVLVGGTAAALHVGHRKSLDADHVITDLTDRFDEVLGQLEAAAGWKTARTNRPVLILGSLDGIETGIRQLIRSAPLETTTLERHGRHVTVPTRPEILRIKAVLILKRNATRDYLDFAALGSGMTAEALVEAMGGFDRLYPQDSGQSALQQLLVQISSPAPYDLEAGTAHYRELVPELSDWQNVERICAKLAEDLFEGLCTSADADFGMTSPPGTPDPPTPFD